jgi:D-alanyl-D-alanine carboxypeptidase
LLEPAYGDEPGAKWLAEHAREYGFIVRYPEGKEDITKITYEPWHFRYVGVEHAKYIEENHLTLEEYIDLLKEK